MLRPLFILATLLLLADAATAQGPTWQRWEQEVLLGLRDREGGFGGYPFDRGRLRRYTPEMDHEYRLDRRAVQFAPEDDAAWFATAHGVRTTTASLDKARFGTVTEVRHRLDVGERHRLAFDAVHQEDFTARRFFIEGSYGYVVRPGHIVGVTHTMGRFKPDLDAEVFYEAEHSRLGRLRAGLVALDAYNNVIFDRLGVDPALQDTLRSYDRAQRLVRVRWQSPALATAFGPVRVEAYGGVQPTSRATVTTFSDPAFAYRREEQFGYAAALVALTHGPLVLSTRAGYWTDRNWFDASPEAADARDYTTRQRELHLGSRAQARWPLRPSHDLEAVADMALVYYRDAQTGTDFTGSTVAVPLDLRETRVEAEARLTWLPVDGGFRASLRWLLDGRTHGEQIDTFEAAFLRFGQPSPQHRMSLLLGYDLRRGIRIEAGASVDLDGDTFYDDRGWTLFDGGFGRVTMLW